MNPMHIFCARKEKKSQSAYWVSVKGTPKPYYRNTVAKSRKIKSIKKKNNCNDLNSKYIS